MLTDFISLFFPRYCEACQGALGKNESYVCIACQYDIPKTHSHKEQPNAISVKFFGKVQLKHVLAYYHFERKGKVQKLLHQLKYGGKPEIGVLIGDWYGQELADHGFENEYDLIVPVPLHQSKLRRRGYNQSEEFAKGLSKALDISHFNILKRVKSTSTQTRKSRLKRWENVSNIFQVIDPELIDSKSVLIVDDVITTGSTLEACVNAVQSAGAKSVGVAAIAAAR